MLKHGMSKDERRVAYARKKFELLVVVNLKEVSKCQSLKDVISCSSIFARKDKHPTDSLLNYISNNEAGWG